jgi:hypothetical protein
MVVKVTKKLGIELMPTRLKASTAKIKVTK